MAPLQQNEAFVANKYISLSTELTEITYSLEYVNNVCSSVCNQLDQFIGFSKPCHGVSGMKSFGPTFSTICSFTIATTLPSTCGDRYRPGLAEVVQFHCATIQTYKAVEGQYL